MIKSYKNDYLIEHFSTTRSVKNLGNVIDTATDTATSTAQASSSKGVLAKVSEYTSKGYDKAKELAEAGKNKAVTGVNYIADNKLKTAAIIGATGTVIGVSAAATSMAIEAEKKGMTLADYIKSKHNNVEKSIKQDARSGAKEAAKGGWSLAKETAKVSRDVMKELCPNCTTYFIIGGVVFLLILVLFYFK
jgi:hypothetical protein